MPRKGHRDVCPDGRREVGHDAYRAGLCRTCHTRRYRAGSPECEPCFRAARGLW